jgi:hypothetical protein
MFPENFDLHIYKEYNVDLKHMNPKQLLEHYSIYGQNEGRICSKIFNRDTLVSHINKLVSHINKLKCLEIGPFDVPVLRGENVKYFDILDKEGLTARAIQINRINNILNMPDIHFVDNTGDLAIIKNEKFDIVLSCHSIEHQIDFVEHLRGVQNLLLPNGYYVIILPDKRYCFDHFLKETTIADIINSHVNKSKFHSIKSVIEHRALTCHNDSHRHWNNDNGNNYIDKNNVENAVNEYNNSINNNVYLDVHSLQFTPSSFKNNIDLLYSMKYIDLQVCQIYPTIKNSCEFYVVLKKSM